MITEVLSSHMLKQSEVVAAAGTTTVFDIDPAHTIKNMRIYIKNTGSNALDAAALEGSFDGGTTWIAIDATAFTTAFGTLASAASATIYETNLNWPRLRITLSAATGGTTADVGIAPVCG